jgi:superoxide dismutase, Fe-Mn family
MATTRREVLAGLSLAPAALVLGSESAAQVPAAGGEAAPAYGGKHEVIALPFDPKKLRGLSEQLVVSHHDNNYAGAVKNLNKVENALAQVTKDTPGFTVTGLKERELNFANSVQLHELYFANLGGDGAASGEIAKALAAHWSSLARWEEEFRATGASLGGGSGWVTLDFDLATQALRTHASGSHVQSKSGSLKLLVLDMYEHAYHMDYGAAAAKYIDAFFQNVRWEEVERRFAQARKAAAALGA